jgi:hypothetical protein
MKNIIIATLFIASTTFGYSQDTIDTTNITKTVSKCGEFHVGSFQLVAKKHIIIKRTETTQTETNIRTSQESVYNIDWIDDCTFHLTPTNEKDKEFFKGKPFVGEIITVRGKTYTCKGGLSGDKVTVTDEVRKLE